MKSLGLWFVFKINGNSYAIDCAYVDYIGFIEKKDLTHIADANESVKGIFKFNGKIVTLLNLREVLGFSTVSEEREIFMDLLENIKNDCRTVGETLKSAIEKREKFTLSINSFKQKFDEWYDDTESKQSSIIFQLLKIDELYVKFEDFSEKYNKIYEKNDEDYSQKLSEILEDVNNICMTEVENVFEETKNIFNNMIRENYICINEKTVSIAFAIDEIIGIEKLEIISDSKETDYICGVAKDKKDSIIMIIDVLQVLKFAEGTTKNEALKISERCDLNAIGMEMKRISEMEMTKAAESIEEKVSENPETAGIQAES